MKHLSILCTSALLALAGCGGASSTPATPSEPPPAASAPETPAAPDSPAAPDPIQAAVSAPRDPADVSRDELRQPVALLSFFGVAPGMRVADLGSGPGYTGSVLALVVGADRVLGIDFHQTTLVEPATTLQGVNPRFLVRCHSSARAGNRAARLLVTETRKPAQNGHPLPSSVRLLTGACHS